MPLERELAGTPGLVVMRSRTTFALSLITLVFRDGTDDYWARQRINERIQNVTLPPGATPGARSHQLADRRDLPVHAAVERSGARASSRTCRTGWSIPQFKQVAGVADVTLFGGETVSFQLVVDPAKLTQYGLALRDVESCDHQQQRQCRRQHPGHGRAGRRRARDRAGHVAR